MREESGGIGGGMRGWREKGGQAQGWGKEGGERARERERVRYYTERAIWYYAVVKEACFIPFLVLNYFQLPKFISRREKGRSVVGEEGQREGEGREN